MDLFILKVSNPQPRGYAGLFLVEIARGIFVGKLSLRVAEQLYEKFSQHEKVVSVVWVRSANTELGFTTKSAGIGSNEFLRMLSSTEQDKSDFTGNSCS